VRPDFKFELLPLHSPLLRQSLLVSFPPLIDMLKFSGYPYLIRGQPLINLGVLAIRHSNSKARRFTTLEAECHHQYFWDAPQQWHPIPSNAWGLQWRSNRHTPQNTRGCNVRSKIRWFTEFCNSHYLSHFAAFFIDARTKRSVVESFNYFYSTQTT
jgi:hypothetical protein